MKAVCVHPRRLGAGKGAGHQPPDLGRGRAPHAATRCGAGHGAAVIEGMRRQWVEAIIQSDSQMTIWLPIRILVFGSRDGIVLISYISPYRAAELSGGKDERVLELLKTVDEKLETLIRTAAR